MIKKLFLFQEKKFRNTVEKEISSFWENSKENDTYLTVKVEEFLPQILK